MTERRLACWRGGCPRAPRSSRPRSGPHWPAGWSSRPASHTRTTLISFKVTKKAVPFASLFCKQGYQDMQLGVKKNRKRRGEAWKNQEERGKVSCLYANGGEKHPERVPSLSTVNTSISFHAKKLISRLGRVDGVGANFVEIFGLASHWSKYKINLKTGIKK